MMILIKQYFKTKILISTKLDKPICETRVPKLVFRTIPCLKFWALYSLHSVYIELPYIDEFWRCSVHTMYICNIKQWKFTKKTIVYIVTLMLYVCMYRARIFTSVLFANIYARWKTIHLGEKKKIENLVKLDNVLKHTIWVTSSRQTLQSMKTNKVRLKYAVKLGKFGLSVHIFLITMNEEK